jgi:serine/threonine protein phosphatase 1
MTALLVRKTLYIYTINMTHLTYAVGDIHGDLEQLRRVHTLIIADFEKSNATSYKVIHIGDLIDRGPKSKGTIDYLMHGIAKGFPWEVIKGNHDRLMQWFLDDPHRHDPHLKPDYSWLHHRIGGIETLASYGVIVPENYHECLDDILIMAKKAIPESHVKFIQELPLFYETNDIFFVHAGINLDRPLNNQTEDDMVWIRENWLDNPKKAAKLILHGHTIVKEITHYGNRVNIDTGAAWGDKLSAVVTIGADIWEVTQHGRIEIKHKVSK